MGSKKTFLLRIHPNMWKDLEVWAADELRSVNGQIEYILKQAIIKRNCTGLSSSTFSIPIIIIIIMISVLFSLFSRLII